MKALTCPSCHTPASPNPNDKIIKCEYCGVSFVNEFFSEEEAGCPEELNKLCVSLLQEMGEEALRGAWPTPSSAGPIYYELDNSDDKTNSTSGTLSVCEAFSLSFDLENYRDSIVFFIELHNELYKEHTGERAPKDWGIRTKEKSLLDILLE